MAAAAPPPNRPIKILMLHGYTQSGPLFQAKTGALRKTLSKAFPKGIELVYPTAPIRLTPADYSLITGGTDRNENKDTEDAQELDAWAWWRKRTTTDGSYIFDQLEDGLGRIASVLKDQGPFDGVIGFSQGAAATAMVASLLEPQRREAFEKAQSTCGGIPFPACFEGDIHPPLKFAVSYSGFAALPPRNAAEGIGSPYAAFYEPKIKTPMLHFIGTQDVVIEEARSLALVERCERREERFVVYHPGGHFLPSTQKASVNALVGFIREVLWEQEGAKDKVEDDLDDIMGHFDQKQDGEQGAKVRL
jgi:hypothetical protein